MKIIQIILASLFIISISAVLILLAFNLPYRGLIKMIIYEGSLLIVALALIGISWLIKKQKPELLQMGNISAKGKRNRLFLIKDNHSWLSTGITCTLTITAVTSIFMIMGMDYMDNSFSLSLLLSNLHWILIFSVVNAFGEEIIYRIIPYEIMKNNPSVYPYISGLFFGLAHFWGNPGGPLGVVISSFLGYFLARSAVETNGTFWAVVIHIFQDIAIFGVLFSFGLFT